MWKTHFSSLYTPPSYIHRQPSAIIYNSDTPNTVENVTGLPFVNKLLGRIQFTPITNFIYKDLVVNTYHKLVSGAFSYERKELNELSTGNSYTFEDDIYLSADIEPLYVNMEDEDLYLTIAYEVKNITTYKNIAMFTTLPELGEIRLQSNSSASPQVVTVDFLTQVNLTPDMVVTFVYVYKIYDASDKVTYSVLNNFTSIKILPILIFTHTFDNYSEIDLLIYKDRSYKKVYSLSSLDSIFDTRTHHGFIINKEHIVIALN